MTDAERLTRLEERFAHLERHVTEQDKVMLGLSEDVARLRKELSTLRGQHEIARVPGETPADERPPHY